MGVLRAVTFLVILSTSAARLSLASDCANVDLHTLPDSPLLQIPVYDQDGTELCYGYVASQLVNYHRMKQDKIPLSQGIHPIYAAWTFKKFLLEAGSTDLSLRRGSTRSVVTTLKFEDQCLMQDADACLAEGAHYTPHASQAELLQMIEHYWENRTLEGRMRNRYKSPEACESPALKEWLKIYTAGQASTLDSLGKIFESCEKSKRPVELPALKVLNRGSDERLQKAVRSSLSSGEPLAMSVCASYLKDRSFPDQGFNKAEKEETRIEGYKNGADCGAHAALIVGQKMIGGQCHTLVRSSWGSRWRGTTEGPHVQCACKDSQGVYQEICPEDADLVPGSVVQYLGCWYPSEELMGRVYEIEHF